MDTTDTTTETQFDVSTITGEDGNFVSDWHTKLPDDLKKDLGDSKAFANIKNMKDFFKTAIGNSKLAGRALLPGPDAPDESWDKVWAQMGIPGEKDSYGLSSEGITDERLKKFAEKTGYLATLEKVLRRAGVPKRIAARIATADAVEKAEQLRELADERTAAHEALGVDLGGVDKIDAARVAGRDALSRLYGTDGKAHFDDLIARMDAAGLADHPAFVRMTHLLSQRLSPGKIVTGSSGTPAPTAADTSKARVSAVLPNTAKALGIK